MDVLPPVDSQEYAELLSAVEERVHPKVRDAMAGDLGALLRAIDGLPSSDQRKFCALRIFQGLSLEETATAMGNSTLARVKGLRDRAGTALAERLPAEVGKSAEPAPAEQTSAAIEGSSPAGDSSAAGGGEASVTGRYRALDLVKAAWRDDRAAVLVAMGRLTRFERKSIRLRIIEGLSLADMVTAMADAKRSEAGLSQLYKKAIRNLAEELTGFRALTNAEARARVRAAQRYDAAGFERFVRELGTDQLNADERRLVELRFLENLEHGAIAAVMDKSESAVEKLQDRAVGKLAVLLMAALLPDGEKYTVLGTVRPATADDVARVVGVSRKTVDLVLRGANPVDPSTVRRLLAAAEVLGYQPGSGETHTAVRTLPDRPPAESPVPAVDDGAAEYVESAHSLNWCVPLVLGELADSGVTGVRILENVGLAGVLAPVAQDAMAGWMLEIPVDPDRPDDPHAAVKRQLIQLGKGAQAVIVDEYADEHHDMVDGKPVGAHMYRLVNVDGHRIEVRDPGRGRVHEYPPVAGRRLKGSWSTLFAADKSRVHPLESERPAEYSGILPESYIGKGLPLDETFGRNPDDERPPSAAERGTRHSDSAEPASVEDGPAAELLRTVMAADREAVLSVIAEQAEPQRELLQRVFVADPPRSVDGAARRLGLSPGRQTSCGRGSPRRWSSWRFRSRY